MNMKHRISKSTLFACLIIGAGLACMVTLVLMPGWRQYFRYTEATLAVTETILPVASAHTQPADPAASASMTPRLQKSVCTGLANGQLNVRQAAGTQAAIVGALPESATITLTGQEAAITGEAWVEITIPLSGWVNARYLCGESQ